MTLAAANAALLWAALTTYAVLAGADFGGGVWDLLASGPRAAQQRRAVNQAHELSLERVLDLEANYQTLASRDPNFAEGVAAFRSKRPPTARRRSRCVSR